MKDFCESIERFHQDLCNEQIGCMFAWEAAKEEKIQYVGYRPDALWFDFAEFINQSKYRVLAIIPDEELGSAVPKSFQEGKDLAWEMYKELHIVCRGISIQAYNQFYDLLWFNREAACNAIPIMGVEPIKCQQLLARQKTKDLVCNKLLGEGNPFALQVIQGCIEDEAAEIERIIPFAMAPYYSSIKEGVQHPRFARDYGVFLTLQSDIHDVMSTRIQDVAKTQDWKLQATGSKYTSQGLHISLEAS